MAHVEGVIIARLLAHAGTAALVSTRVHAIARPQTPVGVSGLPCITVRRVGHGYEETFTEMALPHPTLRVTAYGTTGLETLNVAAQVFDALSKWSSAVTDPVILDVRPLEPGDQDFDGDDAFYADQDFEVWHR